MPAAPISGNESKRLVALRRYDILDTPPEAVFERITSLAARLFETPMAAISLVDQERQWFKSCVGLDVRQTDRQIAFCAHAILSSEPLIVSDARCDPRFADNPLVTGEPYIRFYAGAPLLNPEGLALGTLCILDRQPRSLSAEQAAGLTDLAALTVHAMEMRLAAEALAAACRELAARGARRDMEGAAAAFARVEGAFEQVRVILDDYLRKEAA